MAAQNAECICSVVELFVQNVRAFGDVEVVREQLVEALLLRVGPVQIRDLCDLAVEIEQASELQQLAREHVDLVRLEFGLVARGHGVADVLHAEQELLRLDLHGAELGVFGHGVAEGEHVDGARGARRDLEQIIREAAVLVDDAEVHVLGFELELVAELGAAQQRQRVDGLALVLAPRDDGAVREHKDVARAHARVHGALKYLGRDAARGEHLGGGLQVVLLALGDGDAEQQRVRGALRGAGPQARRPAKQYRRTYAIYTTEKGAASRARSQAGEHATEVRGYLSISARN